MSQVIKGSEIIDRPIFSYDTGENLKEKVEDLIFDQYNNQLLGFLVDADGWFSKARVLPLNKVKAIGSEAVIATSAEAIVPAPEVSKIQQILDQDIAIEGCKIITTDGRNLGKMVDLYLDTETGAIEGYELSGGIFADSYSGRSFVPAPSTIKIGGDVAFVPPETADMMAEQVGGIKAAMQKAQAKAQKTARVAGDRLQETADEAEQKFQEAKQKTETEILPHYTVEQARGKTVWQIVRDSDGEIVTYPSQIVTEREIEWAKAEHQEETLLEAVGLSSQQAASSHASEIVSEADDRLQAGTEELKEKASHLWQEVKEKARNFANRSSKKWEEHQIKSALGRPVTRVILDRADNVILNIGDLITHEAIDRAIDADVLDILLNSVHDQKPELSETELQAPSSGQASLNQQ